MTVTKEFALEIFGYNRFKKQILSSVQDEITLYRCGDFIDLCGGPHLQHTGKIKVGKILGISENFLGSFRVEIIRCLLDG